MNTAEYQNQQPSKAFQWRMIFTAGMGFFTDAYDLFVIGIVSAILTPIWHLTALDLATLNGAALASSALGAVFFGFLADKFGRKKMYGIEVFILFFGAIFSAMSHSFLMLLICRIIVGLGIGGDYPSSAVIASEFSHHKNRGFLVLLVFAMQAVGLVIGPLLASTLLYFHLANDTVWRLLLGLGAIPAASVFYLRRTIPESPHFQNNEKLPFEVSRIVSDLVGFKPKNNVVYKRQSLLEKKWLRYLVGTAGAWFFLDIAFYGNSVSSVLILKSLHAHDKLLHNTIVTAVLFLLFAVPGYYCAAAFIDRIGRKLLQYLGFAMMGLIYLILASSTALRENLNYFVLLFGISYFFTNFGPNTTTFLVPAEIYPANIRARAHGISAAIGKVGAFIGAFALPPLLQKYGIGLIFSLMSGVAFLGLFVTSLLPEMKNRSLLETEELVASPES